MNPVGLAILAGVLVSATAFGLWRAGTDGRFRSQSVTVQPVTVQPATVQPSTVQPSTAQLPPATTATSAPVAAVTTLGQQDLGAPLGAAATLVQFSTVFCQPCRATRRILDEVAQLVEGVRYVDVDAEDNLELVRRLDIRRTPTIFVLDSAGRVVTRATGQPRKADVVAALGELLP